MYSFANTRCNPDSAGLTSCQAVLYVFKNAKQVYDLATLFLTSVTEAGPLIVNNADCVK